MTRVLSLATYPVRRPRHGGQRRVAAFRQMYERLGVEYHSACVYEAPHFNADEVGENDLPLGPVKTAWSDLPFTSDMASGVFAAESPAAYEHFRKLVERLRPDVLQLEHPFLWPLVQRLLAEPALADAKLIYSSHNWEGPLKQEILLRGGSQPSDSAQVRAAIESLELEVLARADITIAVSEFDAAVYRNFRPSAEIHVVPNGVDRPPPAGSTLSGAAAVYEGNRFLFFVGSAYPPNLDGFCRLVSDAGLFFTPPLKSFALCGGVSHLIFQSRSYQRFLHANSERVQFFPDINDAELSDLKLRTHAILLPIQFGGGSNLKTAEAIASCKWVVATSTALRGFEAFAKAPGVLLADTPATFKRAMIEVYNSPPLRLTAEQIEGRESVYWDRCFADSGFEDAFSTMDGPSVSRVDQSAAFSQR